MQSKTEAARWLAGTSLAAAVLFSGTGALAHDTGIAETHTPADAAAHADGTPGRVPLWNNLGDRSFKVTTADPLAQAYFDQGLRWTYGFNHAEALRAFKEAQRIDPGCAMCYWGEALVLGPNTNAAMKPEAVVPAVAAIAAAQVRAERATAREQALIAALAKRYSTDPKAERAALNTAYADAMAGVHTRFADDDDIAVLFAEALMNLSPWDYWEADAKTPKGRHAEVLSTLETVLARNPDHPAAIHLYIHAVEASSTPERAEPYADRLANLMPGAGHLVHMPSHVYYRVGRYEDSMVLNQQAAAADEAYIAQAKPSGIYPSGYYPHNIHFVVVSAQMIGASDIAFEAAHKLSDTISDEVAREIAWVQVIKVAPYYVQAQLGDITTLDAFTDPGDELPFVKAMWHFARAVTYADMGRIGAAETERSALADIGADHDFQGMVNGGVPAPDLLRIAYHVISARMAMNQGDFETAIDEYQQAIAVQDTFPYMEPEYWYVPLRQSLGGALLASGRPGEAEAAFRAALAHTPNNGWAVYGLTEALRAQGRHIPGLEAARQLDRIWLGSREILQTHRL
jgi:tetratricopeptide (TPR) repeat protein